MNPPPFDRRHFSRHKLNGKILQHDLALAGQVQRSLLPPPFKTMKGFELAGRSICCTEVGGDYFDYINEKENNDGRLRIIVGDVSGHGIDAALLVSSARTFLRTRTVLPGSGSDVITQMNRQFTQDIGQSGHFMTLFYLDLDLETGMANWVRAGHEPALIFTPSNSEFSELRGRGLPLGVDPDYVYLEYEMQRQEPGSIIAIGTDGIWEARNADMEFFGKDSFKAVIREHAELPAREIVEAVFGALAEYCKGVPLDDDITLVVLKITGEFEGDI